MSSTSCCDPIKQTCRTKKDCGACGNPIEVGEKIYKWPMYDYDESIVCSPIWHCEYCGNLAQSFSKLNKGAHFYLCSPIEPQEEEYRKEMME